MVILNGVCRRQNVNFLVCSAFLGPGAQVDFPRLDALLSGHTCFIEKCAQAQNFCSRGSHLTMCSCFPLLPFAAALLLSAPRAHPMLACSAATVAWLRFSGLKILFEVMFLWGNLRYGSCDPVVTNQSPPHRLLSSFCRWHRTAEQTHTYT